MSLYIPPSFAVKDRAAIVRLIHDYPFATLVTPAAPEPWVSHIPLLMTDAGEPHGTLIGHFARANPHWQHARDAQSIAIFHGPHAYVSPSWYTEPTQAVPTWNFTAVHAHGPLEIFDDAEATRSVLDALVSAIVAFKMPIRRLDAKFKLSQNRTRDDRVRVIAALKAEGYSEATETAEWMQAYAGIGDGHTG